MERYDLGPQTARLYLRAPIVEDAPALFAMNTDPEVMRYTGEPMPASVEDMRRMIETYPDFDRTGFGRWTCVDRETDQVIGFAGLKHLEDVGAVDLGYRLIRSRWGRGLATEAARACLRFGFDVIGLEYVIGLVLPGNSASIRVLEKVGMVLEGPFDYEGDACLRYGVRRP